MKITLDLTKTANENAQSYFDKAKRAKKKLKGVLETRQRMLKQLEKEKKTLAKKQEQKQKVVIDRKKEWYEKFRWSFLSSKKLVIGGRDATSNEIVVKKHVVPGDLLCHTDMAGAPFFVIKAENNEITQQDKEECALLCAVYSKAWQRKLSNTEVFIATPEQVTKEAQSGEYLSKGAFMVRGKVEYFHPKLIIGIGKYNDTAVAGHPKIVKDLCDKVIVLIPGDKKSSDVAKLLAKQLEIHNVDDVLRALPTGTHDIIPFEQLQWYL